MIRYQVVVKDNTHILLVKDTVVVNGRWSIVFDHEKKVYWPELCPSSKRSYDDIFDITTEETDYNIILDNLSK